jgi:hypothetical protein
VCWDSPKGRNHSEDLDVDGIVIFYENRFRSVEWIHMVQDRGWWGAVVNTVMNLEFYIRRGIP